MEINAEEKNNPGQHNQNPNKSLSFPNRENLRNAPVMYECPDAAIPGSNCCEVKRGQSKWRSRLHPLERKPSNHGPAIFSGSRSSCGS